MVNIGAGWHTLIAIMLIAGGAGLYALRSFRPALARDHDIFFAAVGLLCGGILFFQGWRLDPILQFGQFMLTGSAIFFAFESVRLRGIATEQAKRDLPIVDEDRPVSRVYRAEIDELEFEDQPSSRRIRGRRDQRSGYDEDEYLESPRRRPASRSASMEQLEPSSDRTSRRRPRSEGQLPEGRTRTDSGFDRDDVTPRRRRSRTEPPIYSEDLDYSNNFSPDEEAPRSRRRRSSGALNPARSTSGSRRDADDAYVDFQPLPRLDDETNNPDPDFDR